MSKTSVPSRGVLAALMLVPTVLILAWSICGSRKPRPDQLADEFAEAIQTRNWKKIFEMGSDEEKAIQPWGEKEFVTMLDELTKDWPSDLGPIKIIGDWAGQTTWKHFEFHFTADLNMPHVTTNKLWIPVVFRRTKQDWTPELMPFPLNVSRVGQRPQRVRAEALVEASKKSGMKAVVRYFDRREVSFERMELYLQGKLDKSKIERYVPR